MPLLELEKNAPADLSLSESFSSLILVQVSDLHCQRPECFISQNLLQQRAIAKTLCSVSDQ